MRNVIALVLGGGRGTRLSPLTKYRAKPAVPLAAKYRLIDIPISNCLNSGVNRIYALTQFLSVSLHRHIRQTYRFDRFSAGFVELLAAQQTESDNTDWYQGTADAVRKNLKYFDQPGIEHVLILSGDQLYRMDYREMMETHKKSGAAVTIAGIPVSRKDAGALGIMKLEDSGRVSGFLEKPQTDEEIDLVAMPPEWIDKQGLKSDGRDCVASMGIYLFDREFLVDVLSKTDYQDFGKEVFPAAFRSRHVQVHMFDGYWEDIGTIRAFYESNLSLARADAPFELISADAPIFTRARTLPPTRLEGGTITDSLIADGCRIGKGCTIENSVVGLRCFIGDNVTIKNSIIMGNDEYEGKLEHDAHVAHGHPDAGIGSGTVIEGAIVDKNCCIGKNVRITNDNNVSERELKDGWAISDGIPVIAKETALVDGWKLCDNE